MIAALTLLPGIVEAQHYSVRSRTVVHSCGYPVSSGVLSHGVISNGIVANGVVGQSLVPFSVGYPMGYSAGVQTVGFGGRFRGSGLRTSSQGIVLNPQLSFWDFLPLLIGGGTGGGVGNSDDGLSEIRSDIAAIKSDITQIKNDIAALKNAGTVPTPTVGGHTKCKDPVTGEIKDCNVNQVAPAPVPTPAPGSEGGQAAAGSPAAGPGLSAEEIKALAHDETLRILRGDEFRPKTKRESKDTRKKKDYQNKGRKREIQSKRENERHTKHQDIPRTIEESTRKGGTTKSKKARTKRQRARDENGTPNGKRTTK